MKKATSQNSILSRWFIGIMNNQKAFIGSCIIVIFSLIAIFSPSFIKSPTDFLGTPLSPPSQEYIFGTNGQGQDVFAQTICGARQTLFVGFSAGILVVINPSMSDSLAVEKYREYKFVSEVLEYRESVSFSNSRLGDENTKVGDINRAEIRNANNIFRTL